VQLPSYLNKLNYKLYSAHIFFLVLFIPLFLSVIFLEFFLKPVNTTTATAAQSVEVLGVRATKPTIKKNPRTNVASASATPAPTLAPTSIPQSTRPIYFGMWTEGLWNDPSLTFNPTKLIELQNKISKKVAIAHFYTGWSNLTNGGLLAQLQKVKANGWRPMLSVNPYFFDGCKSSGKNIYKSIADGNCDSFLSDASKQLKNYGSPIFLRFAWEMNIDSMEWSIQKTGSSPTEYIQAWRRFHDIKCLI
jgi:hypothetical protein